jgi:hypothetical protein
MPRVIEFRVPSPTTFCAEGLYRIPVQGLPAIPAGYSSEDESIAVGLLEQDDVGTLSHRYSGQLQTRTSAPKSTDGHERGSWDPGTAIATLFISMVYHLTLSSPYTSLNQNPTLLRPARQSKQYPIQTPCESSPVRDLVLPIPTSSLLQDRTSLLDICSSAPGYSTSATRTTPHPA